MHQFFMSLYESQAEFLFFLQSSCGFVVKITNIFLFSSKAWIYFWFNDNMIHILFVCFMFHDLRIFSGNVGNGENAEPKSLFFKSFEKSLINAIKKVEL